MIRASLLSMALGLAGVALAAASCGSRTGLLVDARLADAAADAPVDGAIPCVPGAFDFQLALTQLMFVVDRSGSMRFDLAGNAGMPRATWRWNLLHDALAETITSFDEQISMGVKFFPEPDVSNASDAVEACRIENGGGIPPARGNAQKILAAFTPDPLGGTPTSEAIRLAAQLLTSARGVARTIVLATDGAPNCNRDLDPSGCVCTSRDPLTNLPSCNGDNGSYSCLDDTRAVQTIRGVAEGQNIPVYVIGLGNESQTFLDTLDAMAVAGGRPRPTTPRHYNVQSPAELANALATIRDTVGRCTYLTPSAPTNPDDILVQIDGTPIPRDTSKTNGWDWLDQAYGELALFGDACARAQAATRSPASTIGGIVTCGD